MKTATINIYLVLSMIVSLIAFYTHMLPDGTNPKIILWLGGISSALSMFLKYFFPSGTWIAKGWSIAFWIVNIVAFLSVVLPVWGDMGLIKASIVTGVIGSLNIILTAFGVVKPLADPTQVS